MNKIVRNINVWWRVYVDYLNKYYKNLVRCFNLFNKLLYNESFN